MIDLHAHVLAGLDDGPRDLDESLGVLRSAVANGVTTIASTPHVRDDHPTSPEAMERGLADVREAAAELPIEILPGGEIAFDRLGQLDDDALRRFGLGGNASLLLLETPYLGWPLGLADHVFDLSVRGFAILLAHPERNGEVQARPELIDPLVERGVHVQLTAASVEGRLGSRSRASARALLARGTAHVLASDSHTASVREGGLRAGADALGDDALARWLTVDVPGALLAGDAIPARPVKRKRRWWRR